MKKKIVFIGVLLIALLLSLPFVSAEIDGGLFPLDVDDYVQVNCGELYVRILLDGERDARVGCSKHGDRPAPVNMINIADSSIRLVCPPGKTVRINNENFVTCIPDTRQASDEDQTFLPIVTHE